MTQDLFAGGDQPSFEIDPDKNYFEDLVGDGKKFKDPEALAKGKAAADLYVKFLESERDVMRSSMKEIQETKAASATLAEMIEKVRTAQQIPASSDLPKAKDGEIIPQSMTAEQVAALVAAEVQKTKAIDQAANNANSVYEKLRERFGPNYQTALKDQAQSLGLSTEFVNDLARNHPQLFFRTLGLEEQDKDPFQAPPRNQSRPNSFAPKAKARSWQYWDEMFKKNKDAYFDPKNSLLRYNDMLAQGESFKDGNWNTFKVEQP